MNLKIADSPRRRRILLSTYKVQHIQQGLLCRLGSILVDRLCIREDGRNSVGRRLVEKEERPVLRVGVCPIRNHELCQQSAYYSIMMRVDARIVGWIDSIGTQ